MGSRHGHRSRVLFWGTLGVVAMSCALPEFKKGDPSASSAGTSGTSGEEGVSGASGQSEQAGSNAGESGGAGSEDGGTQGEAGTSQAGQEQAGGDSGGSSSGSNSGGAAGQTSRGGANDAGAADAGGGEPGGDSSGGRSGANTGGSNRGGGSQGGNPSQGGGTPDGGSENGGGPSNGGALQGGTSNGGALQGGATSGGATSGGATSGGATSGGAPPADGPCDIYAAADTPCVAAYSMVRRLRRAYTGPLYQVRSDSSNQNTGSGGTVHNIGITNDGFADAAAQDSVCDGTTCTVSLLYDQSGNGNDLLVAKAGPSAGGTYAAMDDFESIADAGALTVGGHQVYPLYMAARQGYRLPVNTLGSGMPLGTAAQGIYMLADGTHSGSACCWDFGNVLPDPMVYDVTNTLFFGIGYWGKGAGNGPWFMADFEGGVWAGGTTSSDPGWGGSNPIDPINPYNPSLKVPFALGFLKTDPNNWSLRMADLQTAIDVTTAYAGGLPKAMNNQGGIVLGVATDNSNNSWGTFFEGAIVSGFPSNATELAVMQNIQDVGYGQ